MCFSVHAGDSVDKMVEAMQVEELADWLKDHGFGDDIQQAFKGDFDFLVNFET